MPANGSDNHDTKARRAFVAWAVMSAIFMVPTTVAFVLSATHHPAAATQWGWAAFGVLVAEILAVCGFAIYRNTR